MMMTLFDEEQIMKNHDATIRREEREEGREEGRKEGQREERIKAFKATLASIKNIMRKLDYSAEQAMELLNIPENKWSQYKSML